MSTSTRQTDETVIIDLDSETARKKIIGELLQEGPVGFVIKSTSSKRVCLGIRAPRKIVMHDNMWDIEEYVN